MQQRNFGLNMNQLGGGKPTFWSIFSIEKFFVKLTCANKLTLLFILGNSNFFFFFQQTVFALIPCNLKTITPHISYASPVLWLKARRVKKIHFMKSTLTVVVPLCGELNTVEKHLLLQLFQLNKHNFDMNPLKNYFSSGKLSIRNMMSILE